MLVAELKEIFKRLNNLPTLPNIARSLLQMTVEENVQVDDVVRLVEADPASTARLLRIVNSSYSGLNGKVTSINRAVVLLGFNGIRNALLSVQIFNIFGKDARDKNSVIFELWKHALAVACASELVAENTGGILPEDAFTAGLLHDIGKIALYFVAPDEYRQVVALVTDEGLEISDAEKRIFKMNHATAGRFLAEKWGLPEALAQSIYTHHQAVEVTTFEDPVALTCGIVALADDIVRRQRIGFSGTPEPWEPVADSLKRVGLAEEAAKDIIDRLIERLSVRSVILDLDMPESALYLECLQKANAALGDVTERLSSARLSLEQSNRRLQTVTDLHARLGTSFDCADVLAGIADSIHKNAGVKAAIAYCLDDKGRTLTGACKSGESAPKPFFVSALKGAENDVAGLGQDRDALRFLVSELSSRLDAETGPSSVASGRLLFMPVKVGAGQRAGLLVEASNGRALDEAEFRFLADAAGLVLERSLLEDRLRHESEKLLDSNRRSKTFYEELVNARKLAAIGRMAAGAAHEINNPLAIVSGRVQLLLKMESDDAKKRHLDMIRSQCDRMSRIISDILTFARPEKPVIKSSSVADIVDAAVAQVESAAAARSIRVTRKFPERVPQVAADAAKMEQAFRNILANAVDASAAGQEITVSAEPDEKGKFLLVSFADNGVGMDEETLGRIFEPFFTTKEGRGTGLGLSICHSIVQTHGGKIRVKSAPGKGTVFTIVIPIWRGE
jgi:putative nucleotidyltransferase with HDIG domain